MKMTIRRQEKEEKREAWKHLSEEKEYLKYITNKSKEDENSGIQIAKEILWEVSTQRIREPQPYY